MRKAQRKDIVMKKIFSLVLAVLMLSALTVCFASCKSEDDTLTIGYTLYKPMNYEENGKLVGFDTELAEAVCEKLGMTAKFQLIDWGNKYMELNSGNLDCIWNGFTFNCADDDDGIQRSQKLDFSVAYMNNEQCVVVKAANLAAYNIEEALAGKKVSAENNSAGESYAKALATDAGTYIGVTAQMDTLTELKSGNVDFVVIDKTLANSIIGQGDYTDLAIADGIVIEAEQYAVGFKKGSALTEKVNGAIKELAEEGKLAELAEKYGLSNYVITDYN